MNELTKYFDDAVTDMFNWNMFTTEFRPSSSIPKPDYEVKEYPKFFEIQVSTFGFDKEDLSVDLNDNILHIKMNKNNDGKSETRKVSFSVNANKEDIMARHKNNILYVKLLKNSESESSDNSIPIE